MNPIVDGITEQYGSQLTVKRVNAIEGDGPAVMRQYNIPGHPTILIFDRSGQETQRLIGLQPSATVLEAVEQVLAE